MKKLNAKSGRTRISKDANVTEDVKPNEEVAIPVQASSEALQGRYCNIAIVHHTKREFTFDFVYALKQQANLVSRIITTPQHAKELCQVLAKNIERYESTYGEIKTD